MKKLHFDHQELDLLIPAINQRISSWRTNELNQDNINHRKFEDRIKTLEIFMHEIKLGEALVTYKARSILEGIVKENFIDPVGKINSNDEMFNICNGLYEKVQKKDKSKFLRIK